MDQNFCAKECLWSQRATPLSTSQGPISLSSSTVISSTPGPEQLKQLATPTQSAEWASATPLPRGEDNSTSYDWWGQPDALHH